MKHSSKYLLATLAIFLILQGIGTSFFTNEFTDLLALQRNNSTRLVLQLLGAIQLAWGMLNYMCRNHKYGGIFGRPLLLANLAFLMVSGMAMLKALLPGDLEPFYPFLLLTALYWLFAFSIYYVIRTDQ